MKQPTSMCRTCRRFAGLHGELQASAALRQWTAVPLLASEADASDPQYNALLCAMMQTYIGSMACFAGGCAAALLITSVFNAVGAFSLAPLPPEQLVTGCLLCSLAATLVESLPIPEVDNITVPVAAAWTARWAFGL